MSRGGSARKHSFQLGVGEEAQYDALKVLSEVGRELHLGSSTLCMHSKRERTEIRNLNIVTVEDEVVHCIVKGLHSHLNGRYRIYPGQRAMT